MLAAGPAGAEEHLGTWALSTLTGEIRKLADDGFVASFSPDGGRVAYVSGRPEEIWLMGAKGEDAHRLANAGRGNMYHDLAWSPDGRHLASIKAPAANLPDSVIEVQDLVGGAPSVLLAHTGILAIAWTTDGRLLYAVNEAPPNKDSSSLWEQRTDLQTAKPIGAPRQIAKWQSQSISSISAAADGRRVAVVKGRTHSNIFVGQLGSAGSGLTNIRQITQDDSVNWLSGWMSDGRSVLFHSDRNGDFDLFKEGIPDREAQPVLLSPRDTRAARLSPDGQWILYLAWADPDPRTGASRVRLMRMPVGGGPPSLVLETTGNSGRAEGATGVDGDYNWTDPDFHCPATPSAPCLIGEAAPGEVVFSAFDPVGGRKGEVARVKREIQWLSWDLSPDGSRIALAGLDFSGRDPLSVLSLSDKKTQTVPVANVFNPTSVSWSAKGTELIVANFTVKGTVLLSVDISGRSRVLLNLAGRGTYISGPRTSPDGRLLAFSQVTAGSNIGVLVADRK